MSGEKTGRWSDTEDASLMELYPTRSLVEIAVVLGRDIKSVRYRSSKLGLKEKSPFWTVEQIELLTTAYKSAGGLRVDLTVLSAEIGRHKSNVCRKARELGLTKQNRRKGNRIPLPMVSGRTHEDRINAVRRGVLKHFADKGHPRGMAGKKHTSEVVAKVVAGIRKAWKDPNSKFNSAEAKARRVKQMVALNKSGVMTAATQFSRCKRGYRDDIGIWVRSSWEANYARYLNSLKDSGEVSGWEYEVRLFEFPPVDGWPSSYKPDFKVTFPDKRHEWHEVKGWMTDNGRKALERMRDVYPEEKLLLVDEEWFKQAKRDGLHLTISGWEK